MDAIIIADSGSESVSATNQLKLTTDGVISNIQVVHNFLQNDGRVVLPIAGDGVSSWGASLKLNGLYLYSYLSGQGFDVQLIDSYFLEKDQFVAMLKQSPKAVIISTTFIMNKKTLDSLVRDIRSLAPDIFIIAGGQFVHLSSRIRERQRSANPIMDIFNDEYLFLDEKNDPAVDLYIISPCGENILSQALTSLASTGKVQGLPNTALYRGERYSFSHRVDDVVKTGGITVDWKRMPAEFFKSGVVPLQASYGCPFHCAFCNFMKDKRLMGVKPLEKLIEELHIVQQKGTEYVWFVDDNFRLGSADLDRVCRRFLDEGIKLKWKSFIRPSALKQTDLGLLKEAGCVEVQFGLESADPLMLDRMNKKANPDLYADVIKKVMTAGINCSCYFIFGFPGETEETIQRTREFIKGLEHPELDGYIYFTMFPFIIAPLSPISEPKNALKFGLKGAMYQWEHNTMTFKEALAYATKAFFELETSGIIYHGDNLDMLLGLDPQKRKRFIATRHKLAKAAAKGLITEADKLKSFRETYWEPFGS